MMSSAYNNLFFLQVVFEGVRGTSYKGDIAIDDITAKAGLCSSK